MKPVTKTQTITENLEVGQMFELAGVYYVINKAITTYLGDKVLITAQPAAGVDDFSVAIVLPRGIGFELTESPTHREMREVGF